MDLDVIFVMTILPHWHSPKEIQTRIIRLCMTICHFSPSLPSPAEMSNQRRLVSKVRKVGRTKVLSAHNASRE